LLPAVASARAPAEEVEEEEEEEEEGEEDEERRRHKEATRDEDTPSEECAEVHVSLDELLSAAGASEWLWQPSELKQNLPAATASDKVYHDSSVLVREILNARRARYGTGSAAAGTSRHRAAAQCLRERELAVIDSITAALWSEEVPCRR
jgi:hypothetical protein